MKTIRINGVEQEVPAGILLFDEFLNNLDESLRNNNQVIASIRVNGRELSEVEEDQLRRSGVEQLGDVEVLTASPVDLAYETLNTLEQYIDRIVLSIQRAAGHYRGKTLVTADTYFAKSIDGIDLFVQTIGGIKVALRIGLNSKVALAEASLISIMNDLLEAKRQNNYVYMADLLEKELTENLIEWKEKIFPLFRAWKTA